MVTVETITWQNKTIPAGADFRGVRIMGLLAAWFFFLWLLLSLPPFAAGAARLPALLGFALDKGALMPLLGLMVGGFCVFHCNRQLRQGWERPIARRVFVGILLPLLAYAALALILFEAAALLGGHGLVRPWSAPLFAPLFPALMTALLGSALLPVVLYWLWTAVLDVVMAIFAIALIYHGAEYTVGFHGAPWLAALGGVADFALGAAACSLAFRGAEYFVVVRGHMVLLGWIALLGGSILGTHALFTFGFLFVLIGACLSERSAFLPFEAALLAWSRSALGIALAAPGVLLAWQAAGSPFFLGPWGTALGLALVTQILGVAFFFLAEPPLRHILRPAEA
ncbi:hypothetical protein [Acidisoma sp. 7E03]